MAEKAKDTAKDDAHLLVLQKIPTLMELSMLHMVLLQHASVGPVNSAYGDAQVKYLQVSEECKQKQKLLDEITQAELFIKKSETAEDKAKSEPTQVEKTEAILLKYTPAYGPGGTGPPLPSLRERYNGPGGTGPPLPSLRERYIKELEGVKSSHAYLVHQSQWMGLPYGNTYGVQAYEMGKRIATQQKIVEAIIEAEAFVMDYKAKKDHEAREAKMTSEAREAKMTSEAREAKMTSKERKAREFKLHKEAKDKEAKLPYQLVLLKQHKKAKDKEAKLHYQLVRAEEFLVELYNGEENQITNIDGRDMDWDIKLNDILGILGAIMLYLTKSLEELVLQEDENLKEAEEFLVELYNGEEDQITNIDGRDMDWDIKLNDILNILGTITSHLKNILEELYPQQEDENLKEAEEALVELYNGEEDAITVIDKGNMDWDKQLNNILDILGTITSHLKGSFEIGYEAAKETHAKLYKEVKEPMRFSSKPTSSTQPDRWLENKKKWGVSKKSEESEPTEAKEAENYKTLVKEMQPIWEQCNDKHSIQINLAPTVDAKIAIIRDCIRPHLVYKKLISEAEAEPLLLTRYLNEEIRPYFLMGGKKHKHSKTKKSKYVKNKQSRRR